MVDLSAKDEAALIRQMEAHGEAQVRLMMTSGAWPTHLNRLTLKWLAEKDQEARARKDASKAEETEISRSAKDAAWAAARAAERAAAAAEKANTRATLALTIAAISTITAIVSIWIARP